MNLYRESDNPGTTFIYVFKATTVEIVSHYIQQLQRYWDVISAPNKKRNFDSQNTMTKIDFTTVIWYYKYIIRRLFYTKVKICSKSHRVI